MNNFLKRMTIACGLAWAMGLCLPAPALAQADTGTVLGTVKDSSGAAVARARVTLTNTGTGIAADLAADEEGRFVFPATKIGAYQLAVEAAGFKRAVRSGIQLSIQQQAEFHITLEPGDINQSVEITSDAPLLQTAESSVGQSITTDSIVNLPLNGRDWTQLARLSPGVTLAQPGARASNQFAANGMRPSQNSYLLDGIDNNTFSVDFLNGKADVVRPPVDAISEVKIQTTSFSAEFGRAGGAVFQATTKSGTNELHGAVWEFLRNDKLDANSWGNNRLRIAKPALRQNQFGAAAGGPIWKNKLFIFGDYEGYRFVSDRVVGGSVATALQRNSGYTDFSDLIERQRNPNNGQVPVRGTDALGRQILVGTIFDPATTRRVTQGAVDPVTGLTATRTAFVRDPFPGNRIPAARLNPNGIKLLNSMPTENFVQAGALGGNFVAVRDFNNFTDHMDVRVDHKLGERDQYFVRYSFDDQRSVTQGVFPGVAEGGGTNQTDRTWGVLGSHTHTFSDTLLNEFRVGVTRSHTYRDSPYGSDTSDIPAQFGIQGVPQVKGNGGLPSITIGGLTRIGGPNWLVSERFSNVLQFSDNLTKTYKAHTFKTGAIYQDNKFPWTAPPFARGNFFFNGGFTSSPGLGDGSTGRAQLLLSPVKATVPGGVDNVGGMDTMQASPFGSVLSEAKYFGAYFQDDWKFNSRLTLNLGLRWEKFSSVGERDYSQANFIYTENGPQYLIAARRKDDPPVSQAFLDALKAEKIGLLYSDEYGSGLGTTPNTNFAPRVGFAYKISEKLVARGSFGIFYGGFENRGGFPSLGYNYPFQYDFTFAAPNDTTPLTYADGTLGTLERGLLGVPLDPLRVNPFNLNLRGIQFDYKTPYTNGYNLTLQYALDAKNSIEVAYVGSQAKHLENNVGHNLPDRIIPAGQGLNTRNYIRFPTFAINMPYAASNGYSNYNSLQTTFQRRFSGGLDFLMSYTWSKALSNAADWLSSGGIGGVRAPLLVDPSREKGLAGFDQRHALVASGFYQLPVGKGRRFFANLPGIAEAALGGWSVNWIATYYSGQPGTIACGTSGLQNLGCNALRVAGVPLYLKGQKDSNGFHRFLNPLAFVNPIDVPARAAVGASALPAARAITLGQTDLWPLGGGRTQFSGPPQRNVDFSVFKQFRITERFSSEFRAEFFNLTNTVNYNIPGIGVPRPQLVNGQVTVVDNNGGNLNSPRNTPRQVQLALKLYF